MQQLNFNQYNLFNCDNLVGLNILIQNNIKVDYIIIDPPYNTQNKSFIYNDYFDENEYLVFMKERLLLAKELLKPTGLISIHINDAELYSLKLLLDDIFGKENFIENFIWIKNSIKNNSKTTANVHEYILTYALNKKRVEKMNYFKVNKIGLDEVLEIQNKIKNDSSLSLSNKRTLLEKELKVLYKQFKNNGISQYKFVDDNLDIFRISDVSAPSSAKPNSQSGTFFDIIHPITQKVCKSPKNGYRFSKEKINYLLENNLFYFGKDENTVPQFKRYLKDVEKEVAKSVIVNFDEGIKDLTKIVPNANFNNPKPVSLLTHLIQFILNKENQNEELVILDFFAGSGTILQAVNQINREEKRKLQCFAITNNENNIIDNITLKRANAILDKNSFSYFDFS